MSMVSWVYSDLQLSESMSISHAREVRGAVPCPGASQSDAPGERNTFMIECLAATPSVRARHGHQHHTGLVPIFHDKPTTIERLVQAMS